MDEREMRKAIVALGKELLDRELVATDLGKYELPCWTGKSV